jgi:hypothetical protein
VAHLHYRPHCDTAKFSQWDSGGNFESFVHSFGIQGKRLAAHWPFSCSRVMTTVKCFGLPIQISLLIPQASNQTTERTPREHLQEKIDAVSVPNLRPSELAGQHTNLSEELRKLIVPMGSESLLSFPTRLTSLQPCLTFRRTQFPTKELGVWMPMFFDWNPTKT